MFKKFYLFAWVLLIALTIGSVVAGTFDPFALIAVSIGVVALVYAFGLWAVTRDPQQTG